MEVFHIFLSTTHIYLKCYNHEESINKNILRHYNDLKCYF